MVTVYLDVDEYYPFWDFTENKRTYSKTVTVDEATYERWQRTMAEFEVVQKEMQEAAHKENKAL